METWHFLIVVAVAVAGVACLLGLGYVARCAYRLFKTVRRGAEHAMATAGPVVERASVASERAQTLQGEAQQLTEHAARMQVSLKRVNILVAALREGLAPWRRLRAYVGK
jgi:hypothetical protein